MDDDDFFGDATPKGATDEYKEDANMDWKKSGIDKNERLTLKVNVKEANMYNAEKKRDIKSKNKLKAPAPKGFTKISKKIRDAYDDEEDDDEYILVPVFMDKETSSLEKALTPEERKILERMENPHNRNINLHQSVERDMQAKQAEQIVQNLGKNVDKKIIAEQQRKSDTIDAQNLAKAILQEIAKQERSQISENNIDSFKEENPAKPSKEKPKIKNAEEKDNRQALIDDAEKDKQSVQKNIEKQKQEKEEVVAVTKEKVLDNQQTPPAEKTSPTEEKTTEQNQSETSKKTDDQTRPDKHREDLSREEEKHPQQQKQQQKPKEERMPSDDKSIITKEKSEEKRRKQRLQEKIAAKEKQDEEKRAREIILEKSGRATKEHEAQKFAEEQQRIKENQLNEQKQNQNIIQHQNAGRSR